MQQKRGEPGAGNTGRLFLYFSPLTLLVFLASPENLLDIPTSYMLKNNLHATAGQVSMFRLLTAVPIYFAFLFGLARDLWNPFGWRDRGYFRIFAPLTAAVFAAMALAPLSYRGLLIGMIVAMISFRFVFAAYQGLIALIGQEALMSGRLSTLWSVVSLFPLIAVTFGSGYIAEHFSPSATFLLSLALTLPIVVFGFWKPRAVFSHAYENPLAKGTNFFGDVKRLLRHRAIYPAVLINVMWSFEPGYYTPMQFFLTNHLHTSDAFYADFLTIFYAASFPTYLLYGYLCTRVPQNRLLRWSALIAIPQGLFLIWIDSGPAALAMAVPIGLLAGMATAAYLDLAMRSCPPGLQGTLMALVYAMTYLGSRGSDVIGAKLYAMSPDRGLLYCGVAAAVVYILILPAIRLIPKDLIASADGEPNAAITAESVEAAG